MGRSSVTQVFFSCPKTQIMQKNYDVHRAVTRPSRRTELHYNGVVDFSGGAYGILKAAVEREREMKEGSSAGMSYLQQKLYAAKLEELELKNRALKIQLDQQKQAAMECESAPKANIGTGVAVEMMERASTPVEPEQASSSKTSGAPQSQVLQNYFV